jgi:hypothetical protein
MQKKDYSGVTPEQYDGGKIDTASSAEFQSVDEAKAFYRAVKLRLLNVNEWQKLAGKLLASFQVTDELGNPLNRMVKEGDYIKIDIPGPGSKSGDGFDWVHVEAIDETVTDDIESIGMRVRPAPNPQKEPGDVSHFYSQQATSNFIVTREGTKLTAAIYDRNVEPNQDAENLSDKVRHVLTGAGAMTLFSKIQWKELANGLIKAKSNA